MSADAGPAEDWQHRPRLSRFDRPALTLAELLRAEGGDFVHLATWTMLGRRAQPAEHAALASLLATRGRPAVLARLRELQGPGASLPDLDGLARLLLVQRRSAMPLIGPIVVWLADAIDRRPWLLRVFRVRARAPRWLGWLRRLISRLVSRLAALLRVPRPRQVRHQLGVGHAPPDPGMSPRAIELYQKLCGAVDQVGGHA